MNEMKWTEVDGINKVTEENEKIAARSSEDGIYVAYMAYGGVKVIELSGLDGICKIADTSADAAKIEEMTSGNYEVAVAIIMGEHKVTVTVNDSDEVVPISDASGVVWPHVASSEVYEIEEWDDVEELYDECPFLEGLADVLEII